MIWDYLAGAFLLVTSIMTMIGSIVTVLLGGNELVCILGMSAGAIGMYVATWVLTCVHHDRYLTGRR